MRMRLRRRWLAHLLVIVLAATSVACSSSAGDIAAHQVSAGGLGYRVVRIDLRRHPLALYWRDPATQQPYASIESLRHWGHDHGRRLLFAANAGIYDHRGAPLGLYVERGHTLVPLNTAHGDPRAGNFSIQPNGVFEIDRDGRARVRTTAAFHARPGDVRWATQSGPMLVIDGHINPSFARDSHSLKWRSGVCAPDPHHVVFAISEGPVNFHSFARLFTRHLGCRDALYLDGSISQFFVAGDYYGAPDFMVKPYAGIFAVFAPH